MPLWRCGETASFTGVFLFTGCKCEKKVNRINMVDIICNISLYYSMKHFYIL